MLPAVMVVSANVPCGVPGTEKVVVSNARLVHVVNDPRGELLPTVAYGVARRT